LELGSLTVPRRSLPLCRPHLRSEWSASTRVEPACERSRRLWVPCWGDREHGRHDSLGLKCRLSRWRQQLRPQRFEHLPRQHVRTRMPIRARLSRSWATSWQPIDPCRWNSPGRPNAHAWDCDRRRMGNLLCRMTRLGRPQRGHRFGLRVCRCRRTQMSWRLSC
jgi:hypothetical protein